MLDRSRFLLWLSTMPFVGFLKFIMSSISVTLGVCSSSWENSSLSEEIYKGIIILGRFLNAKLLGCWFLLSGKQIKTSDIISRHAFMLWQFSFTNIILRSWEKYENIIWQCEVSFLAIYHYISASSLDTKCSIYLLCLLPLSWSEDFTDLLLLKHIVPLHQLLVEPGWMRHSRDWVGHLSVMIMSHS